MQKVLKFIFCILFFINLTLARRVIFDYTKNETAGNADWVVDHDYPYPIPSNPSSPTDWDGAISSWGYALYRLGFEIVTLIPSYGITYGNPNNPLDLSTCEIFIMVEPQNPLSDNERNAILEFIRNGGGFFTVADHDSSDRDRDGWDSPRVFNSAFENYLGVHFNVTGERLNTWSGVSKNVKRDLNCPIYNGNFGIVDSIGFWSGTAITLLPSVNPDVYGLIWHPNARQDTDSILFCYGYYGSGRFVALGDSSPCDDGTGDPRDNLHNNWFMYSDSVLILNATLWLSGSSNFAEGRIENERRSLSFIKVSDAVRLKNSGIKFYDIFGREVENLKEGVYFINEKGEVREVLIVR